jgi:polysaccharide biosynthesis protein PslG
MLRGVLLAGLASLVLAGGAQARAVPFGFLGVTADGPLTAGTPRPAEFALMQRHGVELLRIGIEWNVVEPAPGVLRWAGTDALVTVAAQHGMDVLPTISWTPRWAAAHPGVRTSPPADDATYGRFAAEAVRRYGPGGAFWREHPELKARPIRMWQVWNEPNQAVYGWSDQPFAPGYVALLRAARAAIKGVDPHAQIVLAGLVGPSSGHDLNTIYAAHGRGLFDMADLHPFAIKPDGVLRIVRQARHAMNRHGDRDTPLSITELTWPAAAGKRTVRRYGFEVDEQTQASDLRSALDQLLAQRRSLRLEHVMWYTWITASPAGVGDSFDYSGLRALLPDGQVVDRPALAVYASVARRIER